MSDYIPFTYLVKHIPSGKLYYGVRYAKGCSPSDLGNRYFTSSKIIKEMLKKEPVTNFVFEVRKIFPNDPERATYWERKVLRRLKVHKNERWFNQTHNYNFAMFNPVIVKKVVDKNRASGHYSRRGKEETSKRKSRGFDFGSISRKSWRLTYTNGSSVVVDDLQQYCSENNVNYTMIRRCYKSNKPYIKANINKVEKL